MYNKLWLESGLVENSEKEIIMNMNKTSSAFDGLIKFGTAGMRGIMEPGSNRINRFTVAQVSRALSQYMKNNNQSRIVIACDTRNNSELFKSISATIFLSYGLEVFVFEKVVPVPILSYAVTKLHCDFGVYITASHNSKEYNGYKVFDKTGCQIIEQVAEEISNLRAELELIQEIPNINNNFNIVGDDIINCFLKRVSGYQKQLSRNIDITYTGLFGTGNNLIDKFLSEQGYSVHTVESQSAYNGNFPELSGPNPENEEAFEEALKVADKYKSDIIIATDPDADRLGVMVYHKGEYIKLSGNQVGVLLTDYMIKNNTKANVCVIKSDVSSKMAEKICSKKKIPMINVPTGFKYIGAKINENKYDFLFGFEESCGYLIGDYIRDKDSVGASLMICEMTEKYKNKGKTLIDRLNKLYKKYGYFLENTLSFPLTKEVNLLELTEIFKDHHILFNNFRYSDGALEINTYDKTSLIFRKSGTEPKMKVYIRVYNDKKEKAEELLKFYTEVVSQLKI